ALPPITDALAINGPGAAQLTVRRDTGGDYRIFALMVNAPGVVTISGLNITNGLASGSFPDDIGGGICRYPISSLHGHRQRGHSANASANYQVIYQFVGFFQPVDNLPTLNVAPAG